MSFATGAGAFNAKSAFSIIGTIWIMCGRTSRHAFLSVGEVSGVLAFGAVEPRLAGKTISQTLLTGAAIKRAISWTP